MSLPRGTLPGKLARRGKKAHSFKQNQVLISEKHKPHKRKSNGRHVDVESPEFQLLVKLYVPANLLIKNNKVSMKQLTAYLPVLVDDRFSELNFELHVFLSSLVTTYVSSWYCSMLNTENMAFVYDVYEVLCVFIKDLSRRISHIVESPQLLHLVNEVADILDGHLRDNYVENGEPHYASKIRQRYSHNVLKTADIDSLQAAYLRESHVMFDRKWESKKNDEVDTDTSTLRSFDGTPRSETGDDFQGHIYLKVLVKCILQTVFSDPAIQVQGPRDSVIVMNFLTVLLADLVLGKIVTKLSSPDFLLSTVIGGVSEKLSQSLKDKDKSRTNQAESPYEKGRSVISSIYHTVSSVSAALRRYLWTTEKSPTILHSPVLSLFDTITGFSMRKPILASIMSLSRSIVYSINLGPKVENFAGGVLLQKVGSSALVDDPTLAHLIEYLRLTLFDKANDTTKPRTKTVPEIRDELYNLLSGAIRGTPLNVSLMWFAYADENEQEIRAKIESVLRIFGENGENGENGKEGKMNTLLVMKLLDCVVQNVYPEMVSPLGAV